MKSNFLSRILLGAKRRLIGNQSLYYLTNQRKLNRRRLAALSSKHLRVGCILDEFSYECLQHEWDLKRLSPTTWVSQIESLDLVFIESAWRGNKGKWKYACSHYPGSKRGMVLQELLRACKTKGIPTVFWAKEDPVHFEKFIDLAKDFDCIVTTDEDCIPRYIDQVKHERVFVMPFAAQPAIHNPIGAPRLRIQKACFAGSWQSSIYPERIEQLKWLLDAAVTQDALVIYDRYSSNSKMAFPDKYKPFTRPSIPFAELSKLYKRYAAFLNVNTVESSPTMCSRRVFEILASGTTVISSPSLAVSRLFAGSVKIVDSATEAQAAIKKVLTNPQLQASQGLSGLRHVLDSHTYKHRCRELESKIGFPAISRSRKKVSAIVVSQRPEQLQHIARNLKRQKYSDIEIFLVANAAGFDETEVDRLFSDTKEFHYLSTDSALSLGESLNTAIAKSSGDYFSKLDDDDIYGDNYLVDIMDAFTYSGADIVGKRSFFVYLQDLDQTVLRYPNHCNQFVSYVCGPTITAKRSSTESVKFAIRRQGTDTKFFEDCRDMGLLIYSSDPYNFLYMRSHSQGAHTWKVDTKILMEDSEKICEGTADDQIFF